MEARLATSVLVTALMRRAESEGGFAAILSKGDSTAGAVIVILAEKGRNARILERILTPEGHYSWQDVGGQAVGNEEETEKFLARRRKFDPDIWILELDIASQERFADEMNAFD
ncbi:DUF1491 family protein [Enterovirga sp. GCM10030262]|uniref:DUF1491 family protein n=1 Tax=Enterovirga sp. GCM10030262 TaxID=3273391 RepID=UPI003607C1BD